MVTNNASSINAVLAPESTLTPVFAPAMQQALEDLRAGKPIILADDRERENEADLICAATRFDEQACAMMIRECSGIICLCLREPELSALELPPMCAVNQSANGTAFTVTIDARFGVTTGVSAHDRVRTIRAAVADGADAGDLVRPGHTFPLSSRPGGVLERRGHTEGSVDLAELAGLKPAGVLCELMNPDGSMMRGAAVESFAREHQLVMLTIDDVVDAVKLVRGA